MPLLTSAIIPVYNGEKTIRRAVDSALAQENCELEVVVVNDGATDGTAAILREYGDRIRVVTQENRGLSAARNAGIGAAAGEFVAFLDADDEWLPGAIARHLRNFAENPSIGLSGGSAYCLDEDGRLDHVSSASISGQLLPRLFYTNPVNVSAAMARKAVLAGFQQVFRTELRRCEDWDLWIRLAGRCNISVFPDPLVNHYLTKDGMSRKDPGALVGVYRSTFKQMFDGLLQDEHVGALLKQHWAAVQHNLALDIARIRCRAEPVRGRAEIVCLLLSRPLESNWKSGVAALMPSEALALIRRVGLA